MIGTILNSVNVCVDTENTETAFIMFDISGHDNTPEEVQILATRLEWDRVGEVIRRFLGVMQIPSLDHAKNLPIMLVPDSPNWKMASFKDTTRVFEIYEAE